LAPKSRRRLFKNDSAFLAPVGFLKMTRLFEKADRLLAMSRENKITGLTFSRRHSSSVSGSFRKASQGNLLLEASVSPKFAVHEPRQFFHTSSHFF
jgi:hypothetical protein